MVPWAVFSQLLLPLLPRQRQLWTCWATICWEAAHQQQRQQHRKQVRWGSARWASPQDHIVSVAGKHVLQDLLHLLPRDVVIHL